MKLPYDLAGSRSKSRFRNELLWGLKKIYDLHRKNVKYTVVFDYCCDIEVHLENCFEFYQVKTQKDAGTYTVDKLIKQNKSGDSVLGKLYILKYQGEDNECDETKIALVSNVPFNDGKKVHNDCEVLDLSKINDNSLNKIKPLIKDELKRSKDINFQNTYFIRTGIDLFSPDKSLIGETAVFFEEFYKCEPKKLNSLYRVLVCEISVKATYELKLNSYEEVIQTKGIGNNYLSSILEKYIEKTDLAVERSKNYINEVYKNEFKKRVKLNRVLTQLLVDLKKHKFLKHIELEIVAYIERNLESLPDSDIDIISSITEFIFDKSIKEVSKEDIEVLTLLTLKRYEEGVYE